MLDKDSTPAGRYGSKEVVKPMQDDEKTRSMWSRVQAAVRAPLGPTDIAQRAQRARFRCAAVLALALLLATTMVGGTANLGAAQDEGGLEMTVQLNIAPRAMQILGAPYEAWTFGNTVPGTTIRATVGTELTVVLHNSHQSHAHSWHAHLENYDFACDGASMTAPFPFFPGQQDDTLHAVKELGEAQGLLGGVDGPPLGFNPIGPYKPHSGEDFIVQPGETKQCTFTLTKPGAYLYHCHMFPVERHVHGGQYGVIIVYPEGWTWEELPPNSDWGNTAAWVTDPQGKTYFEETVALSEVDFTHASELLLVPTTGATGKVFVANFRAWNDPMIIGPVPSGTPLRVIVTNIGSELHSWHVHGHYFDVIDKASAEQRSLQTLDTLLISPGETYITHMEAGQPGFWFIHDHIVPHAYAGRVPWLEVTE